LLSKGSKFRGSYGSSLYIKVQQGRS